MRASILIGLVFSFQTIAFDRAFAANSCQDLFIAQTSGSRTVEFEYDSYSTPRTNPHRPYGSEVEGPGRIRGIPYYVHEPIKEKFVANSVPLSELKNAVRWFPGAFGVLFKDPSRMMYLMREIFDAGSILDNGNQFQIIDNRRMTRKNENYTLNIVPGIPRSQGVLAERFSHVPYPSRSAWFSLNVKNAKAKVVVRGHEVILTLSGYNIPPWHNRELPRGSAELVLTFSLDRNTNLVTPRHIRISRVDEPGQYAGFDTDTRQTILSNGVRRTLEGNFEGVMLEGRVIPTHSENNRELPLIYSRQKDGTEEDLVAQQDLKDAVDRALGEFTVEGINDLRRVLRHIDVFGRRSGLDVATLIENIKTYVATGLASDFPNDKALRRAFSLLIDEVIFSIRDEAGMTFIYSAMSPTQRFNFQETIKEKWPTSPEGRKRIMFGGKPDEPLGRNDNPPQGVK